MEIIFKDYILDENKLNFTINDNEFIGITGNKLSEIIEILRLKKDYKGEIIINGTVLDKQTIKQIRKKIRVVTKNKYDFDYHKSIFEIMEEEIKRNQIVMKNPIKKIFDSLRIVGLEEDLLNRRFEEISFSEKKLVRLAITFLSNPELIIIEDPFIGLDRNNERKLFLLLQRINEQYNKTFIFVSEEVETIYKYTTKLIVYKNKKIILEGNTYESFQRIDFLKRNRINIPEIVEFTYRAKKIKKAKIDYHKDVRDIMKDIYKHV